MRPVPKPSRRVKTLVELKEQIGRKKVRKEACPLEESEQMALAGWLDAIGVLWFHYPGGAYMHPATVARFKRMGMKKGPLDIWIFTRPPVVEKGLMYVGTVIELKRKPNKPTSEQIEWLEALKQLGWATSVQYTADSAIEWLKGLGYGVRR